MSFPTKHQVAQAIRRHDKRAAAAIDAAEVISLHPWGSSARARQTALRAELREWFQSRRQYLWTIYDEAPPT